MEDRDAKDRHNRITDELLDGAAVRLDDPTHRVEVTCEHAPGRLWVRPLAASGGTYDIGEEDGDRLAHFAGCGPRRRRQVAATGVAETGALAVLGSAARAADHPASVRAS